MGLCGVAKLDREHVLKQGASMDNLEWGGEQVGSKQGAKGM